MQRCVSCLQRKDLICFSRLGNEFIKTCKSCRAKIHKKSYLKHKKRILHALSISRKQNPMSFRLRDRRRRLRNPTSVMLAAAKWRAKQKKIPFNIQHEDITIPSTCPVLGVPFYKHTMRYRRSTQPHQYSPSLDRIDNNKGYIKGNVVVVSYRVNSIKKDASIEELKKIVNFYAPLQVS